jgi:uncharacterized phiE125 gp8 family phage protein
MSSFITVTVPAGSFDLCTAEQVKAEISISNDALLAQMITQASKAIADYCGVVFARETVQETIRTSACTEQMVLRRFPISAVASVTEDGTELAPDDYELDPSGILLRLRSGDPATWSSSKIVVTYDSGYVLSGEDADVPEPLQRAAIELVKSWWAGKDRDPTVRDVEYSDGSSIAYQVNRSSLPPIVADLIAPYRDLRIG